MDEVGAIFLSSGFACAIAVWGVVSQRAYMRRQTTIQYISHLESDRDIIEARQIFVRSSKGEGGTAVWAEENREDTDEALAIGRILNSYELISIGIQRGIIDFELFKRWHRSSAIKYWDRGAPFVARIRGRLANDMFYHEYEQLVHWLKGEAKPPRRRRWTALWW